MIHSFSNTKPYLSFSQNTVNQIMSDDIESVRIEARPHIFRPPRIINPQLWENEQMKQSVLCKCGYCHKILASFRCGACHKTWYCNRQCQRKHWIIHEKQCKKKQ